MSKAKIVLASFVWLVVLAIGVLLYRLWWKPTEQAKQAKHDQEIVDATSSAQKYQHTVKIGLDGFSGYALLRSPLLVNQLKAQGIKVEVVDDGADYSRRLSALADGNLQMAAFPIDALLSASTARKSAPATIVALIDETRGADAVLAYRERFPNIDALNKPDTRFVLVGGSPSETLVRILMHDFKLDRISPQSIDSVKSGEELVKRYQAARPTGNEVFVTWEPFVSQLKSNEGVSVLMDTSRQSGYIVDSLVVSRDFLIKNPAVVKQVLGAYFTALYETNEKDAWQATIESDAKATGSPLAGTQALDLVKGIQWKNTQENFAHFGLVPSAVPSVEDMIDRVKRVLVDTKAIPANAPEIESTKLFTERILSEMKESGFVPGVTAEKIRSGSSLPELNDDQWNKLKPVGTLSSPLLVFARGRATLTESSQVVLDELIDKLNSWPTYYVRVIGNSGSVGNVEANRKLAGERAATALDYLITKGVPPQRLKAQTGDSTGEMSVTFVFGQLAY